MTLRKVVIVKLSMHLEWKYIDVYFTKVHIKNFLDKISYTFIYIDN
jgi:hypothetical protein